MAGLEMYDRPSDAVHVERVWRSEGADARLMQSVTNSNCEMVISRAGGSVHVTVRGPETRVSMVDLPTHGSAVGIVFGHGTTMPHLPVPRLVDSAITADHVTEHPAGAGAADRPGFITTWVPTRR